MRHQHHKYRLGVTPAHRKALIRNLCCELIDHGKIKTTHPKAKATQIYVERLITLAKTDTVANRRLAFKRLSNKLIVQKLFAEVGPKFKARNGGYTRVLKLADARVGDAAAMSSISLVD